MKTVDAIDGDLRFTTEWEDIRRYVFVAQTMIAADAGRSLSRDEAIAFVQQNLRRYIDEARTQHGAGNPVQMVEITRTG